MKLLKGTEQQLLTVQSYSNECRCTCNCYGMEYRNTSTYQDYKGTQLSNA